MSRESVRAEVVALITAAKWPVANPPSSTTLGADHVFSTTPKGAPIDVQVIVQGLLPDREYRYSTPRPSGQKFVDYTVMCLLQTADPIEATAVLWLDRLDWAVRHALRTVTLPINITDATSGEASVIVYIGEEIDVVADGTETEPGDDEGDATAGEGDVRAFEVMAIKVREYVVG